MKAIIAAGGSGTRLRPLTFSSNKQLLPVLNKPLLLYPFEAILETGIKEIGLVVNETRPAVEALLGDGNKWGVKITYINQEKPLGLAHVVKISQSFLAGEPFVYILGDNIFTEGILEPFNRFVKTQPDGLLTYIEHKENKRMGVPYFDEQGRLIKVVEKPENPPNSFGVPGLYFFGPNVFRAFEGEDAIKPSSRGELEITDLYTYLLTHDYRVESEQAKGLWLDPGKFDDMLAANKILLDLKGGQNKHEANIDNESQVIEPVMIGEGVTIRKSVVGPYVTIGNRCTLNGVRITNSVVYENCLIENVSQEIVESLIGKNAHVWGNNQEKISLFIGDNCNVKTN